jgi:diguanylate cyclase (GGDEF)-like protein/PAS domain S-box-containing protein
MATIVDDELARLAALHRTGLLDTDPEPAFDAIARLASDVAGVPIALVSLVDFDRQWFKARVGLDVGETPSDIAFCRHAVDAPDHPLVVPDTHLDSRFAANPLVTGDPGIRFYAGFPIRDRDGHALGTLCVIDREPRRMSGQQMSRLDALATLVQELISLRRTTVRVADLGARAIVFERGFDASGVGQQLVAPDGMILRTNTAFAGMLGLTVDEVVGRHWWELAHPDDARPDAALEKSIAAGEVNAHRSVARYLHADGSTVWAIVNVVPVFLDATERVNFVQITNITDTVEAQERASWALAELRASERRLASLLDPAPDPVLRISSSGAIEAMNPAAERLLRVSARACLGASALRLPVEREVRRTMARAIVEAFESAAPTAVEQLWCAPRGQEAGWFKVRVVPVPDERGAVSSVFVSVVDVTEAVHRERQLTDVSRLDPLTGALNRSVLPDRLDGALGDVAQRRSVGVAVVMVDVDRFKAINDEFGHAAGDRALCTVVDALHRVVRSSDTVARLGGDEFVIVLSNISDVAMRSRFIPRFEAALGSLRVEHEGAEFEVHASAGIAWSDDDTSGPVLLAAADAELLSAKRAGRNRVVVA